MAPSIDFTPLEEKGKLRVGPIAFNLGILVGCGFAVAFIVAFILTSKHKNIGNGFFIIFFAVLGALGFMQSQKNKKLWRRFARINDWQILPARSGLELTPPSIKNIGHSQSSGEVVLGKLAANDFNVHTFQYTTGYGKTATVHETTILGLKLNARVPHLILAHNNLLSSAVQPFTDSQKLKLEGDFNKYFSLYCLKGGEIEALQVLTPDIMEFLIKADKEYNIEFIDSWIYLCGFGDLTNPSKLKEMFNDVLATNSQLQQNYNLSHAAKV